MTPIHTVGILFSQIKLGTVLRQLFPPCNSCPCNKKFVSFKLALSDNWTWLAYICILTWIFLISAANVCHCSTWTYKSSRHPPFTSFQLHFLLSLKTFSWRIVRPWNLNSPFTVCVCVWVKERWWWAFFVLLGLSFSPTSIISMYHITFKIIKREKSVMNTK